MMRRAHRRLTGSAQTLRRHWFPVLMTLALLCAGVPCAVAAGCCDPAKISLPAQETPLGAKRPDGVEAAGAVYLFREAAGADVPLAETPLKDGPAGIYRCAASGWRSPG